MTADEMRISDWSSDVCSSDLRLSTLPCPRGRKRKAFRILLDVAVSTGGGRPVRNSPENIGNAGRCHGAGSARSVGTDHTASTKPRPHSSSARWKGVAAPDRKSVVMGKRVSVGVDLGGRRIYKKK